MAYLRTFNFVSVTVRLLLAMLCAGIIGYGRSKRRQHAGFCTYILTCIGAALSIMIAMYEYEMLLGPWSGAVDIVGMKFDASRFSASVIGGIGFLAAGTIISSKHQQKTGLTTATGLFASAVMGIACGAGFYEMAIFSMIVIIIVLEVMVQWEIDYKRKTRNITVLVEMQDIAYIDDITSLLSKMGAKIFEIDIENTKYQDHQYPSAIFTLRLSRENPSHSDTLSSIAELDPVISVEELIS